jgi:hypothetical protein
MLDIAGFRIESRAKLFAIIFFFRMALLAQKKMLLTC